jgi:hypothetical protein
MMMIIMVMAVVEVEVVAVAAGACQIRAMLHSHGPNTLGETENAAAAQKRVWATTSITNKC